MPLQLLLSLGPGVSQDPNLLSPLWCPAGDHRSLVQILRSAQIFRPGKDWTFHFPCGRSRGEEPQRGRELAGGFFFFIICSHLLLANVDV